MLEQDLTKKNVYDDHNYPHNIYTYHGFKINQLIDFFKKKLNEGDYESVKLCFLELNSINLYTQLPNNITIQDYNLYKLSDIQNIIKNNNDRLEMAKYLETFKSGTSSIDNPYSFRKSNIICKKIINISTISDKYQNELISIIKSHYFEYISPINWWMKDLILSLINQIVKLSMLSANKHKYDNTTKKDLKEYYKATFDELQSNRDFSKCSMKYFNEYIHNPLLQNLWLSLIKIIIQAKKTSIVHDIINIYIYDISNENDDVINGKSNINNNNNNIDYENETDFCKYITKYVLKNCKFLKSTSIETFFKDNQNTFIKLHSEFVENQEILYWNTINLLKNKITLLLFSDVSSNRIDFIKLILKGHLKYIHKNYPSSKFKNGNKSVSNDKLPFKFGNIKETNTTYNNKWTSLFQIFINDIINKKSENITLEELVYHIVVYFNRDKIFNPLTLEEIERVNQIVNKNCFNKVGSDSYYQLLSNITLENEIFLNLSGEISLEVDNLEKTNIEEEKTDESLSNNIKIIKSFNNLKNIDIYMDNSNLRAYKKTIEICEIMIINNINDVLDKYKIQPISEIKNNPLLRFTSLKNGNSDYNTLVDDNLNNLNLYYGPFCSSKGDFLNELENEIEAHIEEEQANKYIVNNLNKDKYKDINHDILKYIPSIYGIVYYKNYITSSLDVYIKYKIDVSIGFKDCEIKNNDEKTQLINFVFDNFDNIIDNDKYIYKLILLSNPKKVRQIKNIINHNFYMRDAFNHRENFDLIFHIPSLIKYLTNESSDVKSIIFSIGFHSSSRIQYLPLYKNNLKWSNTKIITINIVNTKHNNFLKSKDGLYHMIELYPNSWISQSHPTKTLRITN